MADNDRPNMFPVLRYRDADAALTWLKEAFGFAEKVVHRGEDGVVQHAEMWLGGGLVLFGQHTKDGWMGGRAADPLASPVSVYVVVHGVDAHYGRAKAGGATIVMELTDQPYGSREYSARDLEGNLWSFGTYDPCASQ